MERPKNPSKSSAKGTRSWYPHAVVDQRRAWSLNSGGPEQKKTDNGLTTKLTDVWTAPLLLEQCQDQKRRNQSLWTLDNTISSCCSAGDSILAGFAVPTTFASAASVRYQSCSAAKTLFLTRPVCTSWNESKEFGAPLSALTLKQLQASNSRSFSLISMKSESGQ